MLATSSFDTRVCLWNPYTGELIRQLLHLEPAPGFIYAGGHNGSFVRDLKWSANGEALVTICDDGRLRIWSMMESGKAVKPVGEEMHKDGLCLAYSSKIRTLLVGLISMNQFEINLDYVE
jgi:WD repeat/SOCS box-containing protein 1